MARSAAEDRSLIRQSPTMEPIVELIVQVLLEFFGQLLFDHEFKRSPENRTWRIGFYVFIGLVLGLVSLLVLPRHWLGDPTLRIAALILNPIIIGFLMMRVGRWRRSRKGAAFGLENFWSAWALAFSFGLMRKLFAT